MKRLVLLMAFFGLLFMGCDPGNEIDTTQKPVGGDDPEQSVFEVGGPESYIVAAAGGEVVVDITTNVEYSAVIPESASWLSVVGTRAEEPRQETLTFAVEENTATEERSAEVTFVDGTDVVLATILIMQSAATQGDPNPDTGNVVGPITLAADRMELYVGDVVTFTVTDGEGKDITTQSTIYQSSTKLTGATFETTAAGKLMFYATAGTEISNRLTIKVLEPVVIDPDPSNLAFNHRAILVDHTGVNCGNCPGMMEKLRVLANTEWSKHYNEVACHAGGFANGDPAASEAANILNQFYLPNGYPDVRINFHTATLGNYGVETFIIYAKQYLKEYVKADGADVGIAMEVVGTTNEIKCDAMIRAAATKEYRVNGWVLENDIYSPNQAGATKDDHYYYDHALRALSESVTASDIAGKSIGTLERGETYDYSFTLSLKSNWVGENMGVLIVVSAKDDNNRWEVVNSAYCDANTIQPFEFVE